MSVAGGILIFILGLVFGMVIGLCLEDGLEAYFDYKIKEKEIELEIYKSELKGEKV